ncbi:ribonuclease inhibitor [Dyadobacter chenwenxiniae]|uniref:Ribonuclease inhibitor n=1 Tax=Dyadobacter chenwenxiniae TaxID=2906456 RepID=A0A9X1PLT8_9BACT|nr:c-type cytochrome domain-containing protein [Dyadobacter chenwenxiniae]MCF0062599.1 ribonuclease inhibitor [Dyadobacter chenwenxiniae]UON83654.1 ribonuclease inhibitor [Dyadobacter chenwenxiniae]
MHYILLQDSSWATFIGRFHPAIVHFPIGFLLIGALLELGRRRGKLTVSESVIVFILLLSAISATLACIAGYLLSLGGGYHADLLSNHMWKGIGVAVFAWIAWLIKSDALQRIMPAGKVIYLPAILVATALTLSAGHDGGSLTHGEGYLTQYTPEPFRGLAGLPPMQQKPTQIKPIADVQQASVYTDIVQPILEAKCTQCHSASKSKGDLRMDQLALLVKGGKNGPAFVVGKGAESDMIKRCLLPENEDQHMPPKGKLQLTADQIALLSWWIDQGAPADKKVAQLTVSEAVKPALASLGKEAPANDGKAEQPGVLSLKVPQANEKDIENLRKAGLMVNTLSQDQNLLEISAVNSPGFSDKQMKLLQPVARQITWLKLGGTAITDAALQQIAKFPNLSKLHLEHTVTTDHGIVSLKPLAHLSYINIVGTKVGDKGLKAIAEMKALRSIYVWQSAVTDSAVSQVGRQKPNLLVMNGLNEATVAQFVKAGDANDKKELKNK